MNKEEASMATQIQVRPDTRDEKFSEELIHPDIKEMFKKLKVRDYQIIVITDGGKGAYAYDGEHYYYCPCLKVLLFQHLEQEMHLLRLSVEHLAEQIIISVKL